MIRSTIKVIAEWATTHDGAAHTRFRVRGATETEVRDMIERDELSAFAGGTSFKVGDKPGRYAFNPLGGPPGTLRDVDALEDGSHRLTLTGPIHGGGAFRISTDAATGDVLIEEQGITYRPDLRYVPVAGQMQALFEATIPVFGGIARAIREGMESVAGAPLAALHVHMAQSGRIAKNLEEGLRRHRLRASP